MKGYSTIMALPASITALINQLNQELATLLGSVLEVKITVRQVLTRLENLL